MKENQNFFPFGVKIEEDVETIKYHCLKCKYEVDVPEFIIDEFIEDDIFTYGINADIKLPLLECPKCGANFVFKSTTE